MRTRPRQKPKPKKDRVFGEFRRPKLLRRKLPLVEASVGVLLLAVIVLMTAWVATRRDAYDPGERDLDVALLLKAEPPKDLYTKPLQRWSDPALPAAAPQVDLGPFPVALLSGGWRAASRAQTYTSDTLYEKINGQAEQYVKFGFRQLDFVSLEHVESGTVLDLFLYDQATFPNSLGLFAEQRGSKPVRSQGALLFTPTALGAMGMFGHHVFHLIGSVPGEIVSGKVEQVLQVLSARAGAAPQPEPFTILHDGLGHSLGNIAYVPVKAFQLGFAERFWFARPEPGAPARSFLHVAESEERARELFERLQSAQRDHLEPVESRESHALYRHAFLGTYFAFAADGRFVFGVEDHERAEDAVAVVARLHEAVARTRPAAGAPLVVSELPETEPAKTGGSGGEYEESEYEEEW